MSHQNKSVELTVSSSLRSLGYFKIEVENETENLIYMHADGVLRNIILMVIIITISNNNNYAIPQQAIGTIRSKAKTQHREPWSVFVEVDNEGRVSDKIKWKELSMA